MPHAVDHHAILERLAATRGGARNAFAAIDPVRTAHLVIDLQNGFMEPGAPVEVPEARTIVDNVNRLSAAVREGGGLNVFVRFTTPGDGDPAWPVFYERMGLAADGHRTAFAAGAHHWQLWPALDVRPEDAVIEKTRFSAFTPGASGLDALLRGLGIDTVIVSGTLTNCCCESTARDAMQLNYRVLMAADANAALSDAEHAATLHILAMVFADLHATDELVELLKAPALAG
ncbi:MAG TPA: isochorismatase family cysteine hydrolase [Croceibacterium sp.]|nr:isochorismatase family cysteine hydrolase [Croceibacterium sp.]